MSADNRLGFKGGEGVLRLSMGVLDLDRDVITIDVNDVCCVLHLVAEPDKVCLRFLSDVVVALEVR